MTVCPCCGTHTGADLRAEGCGACGSRAVGPPLPRPERELPAYGSALAVCAAGLTMLLAFVAAAAAALAAREPFSLTARALVAACEVAAWRLKWAALAVGLPLLWASVRACARMRREPARFTGHRAARAGLALSCAVIVGVAALVVATVPERLRRREMARRAADNARVYAAHRALLEYSVRFGTYPPSIEDLSRLPDPDGSLARVMEELREGAYRPAADLASLPPRSRRGRRPGAAVKVQPAAARAGADEVPAPKFSYTSYELVLPGRDGVRGTPDDLLIRDGALIEQTGAAAGRPSPAGGRGVTSAP